MPGSAQSRSPLLAALLLAAALGAASAVCPPAGFDSVADFDLQGYVAASWYIQQQVPLVYQPASDLYCVKATYRPINPFNLTDGLRVYNYANQGRINGPQQAANGSLVAVPGSRAPPVQGAPPANASTAASKLLVGPAEELPRLATSRAFGPYWIVATGPSANPTIKYDWALVSGGPPIYSTESGCSTFNPALPATAQFTGGLWLFTRAPVDPVGAAAAKAKAEELGIDTSGLLPVQQDGCKYKGSKNVLSCGLPTRSQTSRRLLQATGA